MCVEAYSCSMEICLDTNGDKKLRYLQYFMHRIKLLQFYKIIPVVFDGGNLPCKSATDNDRNKYVSFLILCFSTHTVYSLALKFSVVMFYSDRVTWHKSIQDANKPVFIGCKIFIMSQCISCQQSCFFAFTESE